MDFAQKGVVSKDDFINILFEAAKECLQPSQTMSMVQQFATGDEVNYTFFLKSAGGDGRAGQDEASPHIINAMKEQVRNKINSLNEQDRSTIDKLRKTSVELMSQGLDIATVFQKFAQIGSDKIR